MPGIETYKKKLEVVSKVKSSEAHQNKIWLTALSILPGAIF